MPDIEITRIENIPTHYGSSIHFKCYNPECNNKVIVFIHNGVLSKVHCICGYKYALDRKRIDLVIYEEKE